MSDDSDAWTYMEQMFYEISVAADESSRRIANFESRLERHKLKVELLIKSKMGNREVEWGIMRKGDHVNLYVVEPGSEPYLLRTASMPVRIVLAKQLDHLRKVLYGYIESIRQEAG